MAEHRRSHDTAVSSQPHPAPADARPSFPTRSPGPHSNSEASIDTAEVLDLIGDEYVCDILRALEDDPMPARELAETCDMSRPTVYRRLNRLTDAGLVDSRLALSPDGHHRDVFRLVVTELHVEIGEDGLTGSVPNPTPSPADD
jgi:DNA-binding transcriptional ArsR family regulator